MKAASGPIGLHVKQFLMTSIVLVLVPSCSLTKTISGGDYLQTAPFTGRVTALEILPVDWSEPHRSATTEGFCLDLLLENGERLRIEQETTSAGWSWATALRRLRVGRTYRFAPTEKQNPVVVVVSIPSN